MLTRLIVQTSGPGEGPEGKSKVQQLAAMRCIGCYASRSMCFFACPQLGTCLRGTWLHGYLALQGNIHPRTAKHVYFRELLATKVLGTHWAKYPFSRCQTTRDAMLRHRGPGKLLGAGRPRTTGAIMLGLKMGAPFPLSSGARGLSLALCLRCQHARCYIPVSL